jgi:Fic family protein
MTNLLLLQAGYVYVPYVSHEKLIEEDKPDYYLALRTSQKTFHSTSESVVAWMAFFLKIVLQQSQAAVALLAEVHFEKTLSPKQQAVWRYLQSTNEATPRDIAQHTHIPRPTVSQALTKLLAQNKIERIGQGRATRYRAFHA